MFIERATAERFSSLQRSETYLPVQETLRSAGARIIEFGAFSIDISPHWGEETENILFHCEVESQS
jgi:hypothetical protein